MFEPEIISKKLTELVKSMQDSEVPDLREFLMKKYLPNADFHYQDLQLIIPMKHQPMCHKNGLTQSWIIYSPFVDDMIVLKRPDMSQSVYKFIPDTF